MHILRTAVACAALSLASHSMAADVGMYGSSTSAFDWSGFYAGVYAGAGSGQARSVAAGVATDIPLSGALAGVTVGGNMQYDEWVFGLEGDLAWSGIAGSATCTGAPAFTCNGDVDWTGSVRGRIGYSLDTALLYATAGLAVAGATATVTPTPGGLTGTHSDTLYGWTVGGGAEIALSNAMSVKAEYGYSDYGTVTAPAGTLAAGATTVDVNTHVIKAGLNFHF